MKPSAHIVASSIIGICVWVYFRSFSCAITSFLVGVLIDFDHVFDYYKNHHFTLKIKDIYCACVEVNMKKLYLVLHSYELVIIFWIVIYAFSLGNIWKAAAIGLTQHMLFDQFTNPMVLPGYFMTYRIMKGFKKESLLK
jgi:dolichol kinase